MRTETVARTSTQYESLALYALVAVMVLVREFGRREERKD